MINIVDKRKCVGCSACVMRCPKQCIALQADDEGFLYPIVNQDLCIDCGLCDRVCPVINQFTPKRPLKCYASKSLSSEILRRSSSGGIFGIISELILSEGGVVFGAAFAPDMSVYHCAVESLADLPNIQRSKYSQSIIGSTYVDAEIELKAGRKVLFSGTPCQIAGFRHFLKKDYPNLLTIDVACHAVPSPKVWQTFIESKKDLDFNSVNFRDKKNGWLQYGFSLSHNNEEVFYQRSSDNAFMRGFLKDLYSRPSCSMCPAKEGKSGSDLTLADFWGIWDVLPGFDFRNGASAVIINTSRGQKIYDKILACLECLPVEYEDIIRCNPALVKSAVYPRQRKEFWSKFPYEGIGCIDIIVDSMQPSFVKRTAYFILRKLRQK